MNIHEQYTVKKNVTNSVHRLSVIFGGGAVNVPVPVLPKFSVSFRRYQVNESTKVQTLGMFLGIDRSMSWKQRCYVSVSYVSM